MSAEASLGSLLAGPSIYSSAREKFPRKRQID